MQPQPPTPPVPPGAPVPPAGSPAAQIFAQANAGASPAEVLRALRSERSELRSQLDRLEGQHRQLAREIQQTPFSEVGIRKGLEGRLAEVDQRISDVEKQIATADMQVARASGVAGANVPDRPPVRNGPPDEVFVIPIIFIIFVLFPLTIAYARRLWRRGAVAVSAIPTELMERLGRLETAVDSVALEVERIGEGQRFVSKLFAEGGARHLGVGAAQPVEVESAEPVPVGARGVGR